MDDLEDKIQNNDCMEEIEHLNYKMNDLKRFLSNQLKDIKNLVDCNETIIGELESLKNRCEDIKDLEDSNESIIGELESLNNRCGDIKDLEDNNESIIGELVSLKKENKQLKEKNAKNQKILDSYNEHFKLLFYLYDLKPLPFLKNFQDISLEVLDFVVNVCEKHDIRYWLDAGTLLGAVRHEGFLPWDDDIDIGMMREEYNRFQEAFDLELKNHNLQKAMKWKLLRHGDNILYFIQVSYAGFAILDILPYDYAIDPQENMEELYFAEKSKFKSNIKNGDSYPQAVAKLHKNLNLSFEKQDYVVSGVEKSSHGVFCLQYEKEMFPLSNVTFNGKEYCGLKDNDAHLTALFGDWRKLPNVVARHNRIYKIKERPEINEFLVKKINMLRAINNNF